jgi:hypothetical protein
MRSPVQQIGKQLPRASVPLRHVVSIQVLADPDFGRFFAFTTIHFSSFVLLVVMAG